MGAIVTQYNGVIFRSRLEARWAAFLDLCGLKWMYEVHDMDGWIPDFFVMTRKSGSFLLEAKPGNSCDELLVERQKHDRSNHERLSSTIYVCGASPSIMLRKSNGSWSSLDEITAANFWELQFSSGTPTSKLLHYPCRACGVHFNKGVDAHVCWDCNQAFHSDCLLQYPTCPRCAHEDLRCTVDSALPDLPLGIDPMTVVISQWNRAGNIVQWMPSRKGW